MASADRIRWNEKFHKEKNAWKKHSPFLDEIASFLPKKGRAIDVAGGPGRNALWLAKKGFDVTLVDISDEALTIAKERAITLNLTMTYAEVDLEEGSFPEGPWDLVLCHHYLPIPILPDFRRTLSPHGLLVICHPTKKNIERNAHPSARYLVDEGVMRTKLKEYKVTVYKEAWFDGVHEVRLLAQLKGEDEQQ